MSKTLDRIRKRPWVAYVDDERDSGSSIIVTLKDGYEFAGNEGCGVEGYENVANALSGTARNCIFNTQTIKPVKVVRTCPRCKTHAYHWGNDKGVKHRIACARCSHEWMGRIKKEEME